MYLLYLQEVRDSRFADYKHPVDGRILFLAVSS